MDIHQEKWDYTAMLVAENAITQEQCDTLKLSDGMNMFYSDHLASTTIDCINWGWSSWLKAKAQAIPDGYVLMPIKPTETMVMAVVKEHEGDAFLPYSLYDAYVKQAMLEAQEPTND
ncbi:hypothetical protein [Acinetobacter sp. YH01025]|uniref:hypothetical protein n=1 Tax=Acinetobacter sp. YH01025 TaxID=2601038 RepID=UPI0015D2D4BF|nr:hypothetical protein [Acinetobacter sp. YH01025]